MENSESINSQFVNTISLRDNDNFQQIYASQLYGTHFCVYGKFHANFVSDKVLLDRVDLKLINYKGLYDIGIVEDKTKAFQGTIIDFEDAIGVDLCVRGLVDNPKPYITINFDDYDITKIKNFDVFRTLLPLHDLNASGEKIALKNGLFDSEFFLRDGLAVPATRMTEPRTHHKSGFRCYSSRNRIIF